MGGKPGRRERPLDSREGPLERFALGLRELRETAGLTYTGMAEAAHFAASTLSQAAAGQRLPTREVLLAYVQSCGGDPTLWEARWQRVRNDLLGPEEEREHAGVVSRSFRQGESTSFVCRDRELAEAGGLLERGRLVTLVGVGGVGKTRLARRILDEVAGRFTDGQYCTELADISDNDAVAVAVAAAFGVHAGAGQDPVHALAEALKSRSVLLLLDNCEHVLHAAAHTTRALLTLLPQLRILATSRQPLDIDAEHVLQVRPLDLPTLPNEYLHEAATTVHPTAVLSPAVTLFADRAEAASPGFRVTGANQEAVARVCRRLDGLPLALEIAARRLRTLTVDELLQRLDHRFRLLGPGGSDRTAPPRHRALRALFDWSYELCTRAERSAWEQLSLCSGGVLLSDAEHLCERAESPSAAQQGPDSADDEVFEALAGLVDKSLLTRAEADGRTRLHMLETVRAYGQERLAASGRAQLALRRHRAWYFGLAAQAGDAYGSSEEAHWLRRLRAEHPNLRQIATAPPPADEPPQLVLRAAHGFWLHCLTSGNVGEGAHWMRMIFERHPQPSHSGTIGTWCRAAWGAGFLLLLHGDPDGAHEMISRGEQALATSTASISTSAAAPHTSDDAARRAVGSELIAAFLQLRSLVALVTGDLTNSDRYARACLNTGHRSSPLLTRQQCIAQLGFCAVIQSDHARATTLLEQALAISDVQGDTWHRCYLLWALAIDRGETGRPAEALDLLHHALQHIWEIDEHMGEASLGEALAWLLASSGDARAAAVVLGAVDRVWHPSGIPRLFGFASLSAHRARGLREARRALGEAEFQHAYQEGRRLGLRPALKQALRDIGNEDAAGRQPGT